MSTPEVLLALREMDRDDLAESVEELINAAVEARSLLRTALSVNCKCDDEFIVMQTCRLDGAIARCKATP